MGAGDSCSDADTGAEGVGAEMRWEENCEVKEGRMARGLPLDNDDARVEYVYIWYTTFRGQIKGLPRQLLESSQPPYPDP
jgi:hypothetical protein